MLELQLFLDYTFGGVWPSDASFTAEHALH